MIARAGAISPELAAAQEQLIRRRQKRRQERLDRQQPVHTDEHGRLTTSKTASSRSTASHPRQVKGRESIPLTQVLAAATRRRQQRQQRADNQTLDWLPDSPTSPTPATSRSTPQGSDTVRLYPDLALAMLQQQEVAVGRIWLLLHHLDHDGRGWVTLAAARTHLAGKTSKLRVCGWRQLRNLFAQGDGLFWTRDAHTADEPRIWLRSLTRVATAFNLPRLSLRSVALPVNILTDTIGTVRAHFYASFHSARVHGRPIARETLSQLSGISRRTQQAYEEKVGVKRQSNWVIGDRQTPEALQEAAWRRGEAFFTYTDQAGTYGRPGQQYLAWQLPNSYTGPHAPHSRGHQKQINQTLADLFTKGITGNGEQEVERQSALQSRHLPVRFYAHGEAAVRASTRVPATEHYWQSHLRQGGARIWHLLPVQEG